jgi:transcriptional regulator with XRE-family HTH domain
MADITSDMMVGALGASPRSIRKRIGRRAQTARLASGRSQADIARAAGVSVPTVQRFEAGSNVSIDVLARIAIALDAERDLNDLFPLPDARTIDELLARKRLPRRGRTR